MPLSDEEREKLAAKYETSGWKPPKPAVPPIFKNARAGVWAAILLVFFWLLSTTRVPLQRCDDFYVYVGAASIASGQGFSDISRPDKPPLLKYPPLRSLIQVPFLPFLKDQIRPLRYVAMAFFAVGLFVLYPVLRRQLTHRQTLFVLLAIGFNPATVRVANFEGNAGITFLLWILTYRVVDRFVEKPGPPLTYGAILGGLLTLCFYCHRMAFSLIPVVLLYLYWRKQEKLAGIAGAVTLLCCFPWLLRSWHYSGHWISPEYEWEITTRIEQSASQARGPVQVVVYATKELLKLPLEIGYGLFPWWKGSGGAPWQFLTRYHIEFIGPVSSYLVGLLSLYGFVRQLREKRSVAEFHFIAHCLMLALFFVAFQYLIFFIPYFYLWLFVGLQPVPKLRKALLLLCLGISMAKSVVAFWLFPSAPVDKDARWAWIPKVVPAGATVHYLGLDNYALAPLRWFDTGRMAVGVTEEELKRALDYFGKDDSVQWLSLPTSHPLNSALHAQSWKKIAWENLSDVPIEGQEVLSDAQRNFLRLREGSQTLWKRPD